MKIVALGANLPSSKGTPAQTLYAALTEMARRGIWPVEVSRVWRTAPVPADPDVPWYYNAVAVVETEKDAAELLAALLAIEADFGRVRTVRNAPRVIDLDLIAYDDVRISGEPDLIVPHPRMDGRAFVLLPMQDVAEGWVHPVTGGTLEDLVASLPADQVAEPVEGGWDEPD